MSAEDGEAAFLLRLLERRFGVLSADIKNRVAATDVGTLEAWGFSRR
jgi:hypothetical protein